MDDGARDKGDADAARAARRRELERLAYGRDTDPDARADALTELTRLAADAPAAQVRTAPASDDDDTDDESADGDRQADADEPGPTHRRRPRRRMLVGGFVVGALLLIVAANVVPAIAALTPQPASAFDRTQTDEDRDIPDWLRDAFTFAESSTDQDGLADRLLASVRREEGADGLVGYLFRDRTSDTYCLAGEQGYDCSGPSQYELNGLLVTLIDPRDPAEHALRFEMSADEGFRARVLQLDRPATVETMNPQRWPQLITRCLDSRGFAIAANSDGGLIPAPASEERKLELAMAILHCKGRFPFVGEYLAVTHR